MSWALLSVASRGVAVWRDVQRDTTPRASLECLRAIGLTNILFLSTDDIRGGKLCDNGRIALLVVCGDFECDERLRWLGDKGTNQLIRFVEEGGAYVGEGDGARLALSIGLLPSVHEREPCASGSKSLLKSDDCVLRFTPMGLSLCSTPRGGDADSTAARVVVQMSGGPVIAMPAIEPKAQCAVEVVCTFESELMPSATSTKMRGSPAIVIGHRERGRIVLSSPSVTSGCDPCMLLRFSNIVRWATYLPTAGDTMPTPRSQDASGVDWLKGDCEGGMPQGARRKQSAEEHRTSCHVERVAWMQRRTARYAPPQQMDIASSTQRSDVTQRMVLPPPHRWIDVIQVTPPPPKRSSSSLSVQSPPPRTIALAHMHPAMRGEYAVRDRASACAKLLRHETAWLTTRESEALRAEGELQWDLANSEGLLPDGIDEGRYDSGGADAVLQWYRSGESFRFPYLKTGSKTAVESDHWRKDGMPTTRPEARLSGWLTETSMTHAAATASVARTSSHPAEGVRRTTESRRAYYAASTGTTSALVINPSNTSIFAEFEALEPPSGGCDGSGVHGQGAASHKWSSPSLRPFEQSIRTAYDEIVWGDQIDVAQCGDAEGTSVETLRQRIQRSAVLIAHLEAQREIALLRNQ